MDHRAGAALTLTQSPDARAANPAVLAVGVTALRTDVLAVGVTTLRTDANPAPRHRADKDPRENREGSDDLRRRGGVTKRQPADSSSNQRLEVDKRPRDVGGHSGLPEGEKPERQQRPHQ